MPLLLPTTAMRCTLHTTPGPVAHANSTRVPHHHPSLLLCKQASSPNIPSTDPLPPHLCCGQAHDCLCQLRLQLVKHRGAKAFGAATHHARHLPAARLPTRPNLVNGCTRSRQAGRQWWVGVPAVVVAAGGWWASTVSSAGTAVGWWLPAAQRHLPRRPPPPGMETSTPASTPPAPPAKHGHPNPCQHPARPAPRPVATSRRPSALAPTHPRPLSWCRRTSLRRRTRGPSN